MPENLVMRGVATNQHPYHVNPTCPEDIRLKAKGALDRMLAIPRDRLTIPPH